MQPLARTLRPKTFKEIQGHAATVHAIQTVLNPLKHHTFLLSGPRGLGKTTLSRLIGQALLCEKEEKPCGLCETCQAIHQGRYSDFIEVDAASKTKVEDVRELVQSSYALPLQGTYKIYLFDEAHMLSTHSFNALLKAFEEPPAHVIYILATTEPHKILPTVRSRCLAFHLQKPTAQELMEYLQGVCDRTQVAYHTDLLKGIVTLAQGSYRDLLNIYQHALLIGHGSLVDPVLYEVLAVIDASYWEGFFQSYQSQNLDQLAHFIGTALAKVSPEIFIQQLFEAIFHSRLSSEERMSFYLNLSEFSRLGQMHPEKNRLLEVIILKSCIEHQSNLEKKKSRISLSKS